MDTMVIGSTVAGLTLAGLLARDGHAVALVTPHPVRDVAGRGVATASLVRGTTAHEIALRHGLATAAADVRGLGAGVEHVRATAARLGVPCEEVAARAVAVDGHLAFELRHEARALREGGETVTFTDEQPFPVAVRPMLGVADSVRVDLPAYVDALLRDAREAGVEVIEDDVAAVSGRDADRVVDTIGVAGARPWPLRHHRLPFLRAEPVPARGLHTFVDTGVAVLDAGCDGVLALGRETDADGSSLRRWADRLGLVAREVGWLTVEAGGDGLPAVGPVDGGQARGARVLAARGFGWAELAGGTAAALELHRFLCGDGALHAAGRFDGTVRQAARRRFGRLQDPMIGVRDVLRARGMDRTLD